MRAPVLHLLVLFLLFSLFGCNPFGAFDNPYDPEREDANSEGSGTISESHSWASGYGEFTFKTNQLSFGGGGSSGSLPTYFGLNWPVDTGGFSRFYMLLDYFQILTARELRLDDTSDSWSAEYADTSYSVDYTSDLKSSVDLPIYAAEGIHGQPTSKIYGDLCQIDAIISSGNSFLSGSAFVVFASSYPPGLLYMAYYHDNGLTSHFYAQTGGGSTDGTFFPDHYHEYRWSIYSDPASKKYVSVSWDIDY